MRIEEQIHLIIKERNPLTIEDGEEINNNEKKNQISLNCVAKDHSILEIA